MVWRRPPLTPHPPLFPAPPTLWLAGQGGQQGRGEARLFFPTLLGSWGTGRASPWLVPSHLSHHQPAQAGPPGWGQRETEHSVSGMSQSGGCSGGWWTVCLASCSWFLGSACQGKSTSRRGAREVWGCGLGLIALRQGCLLMLRGCGMAVPKPTPSPADALGSRALLLTGPEAWSITVGASNCVCCGGQP